MPGWVSEGALEAWDESLVENEEDLRIRYADQPRQPLLRCGYCDREARPWSHGAGLEWFHHHDCVPVPPHRCHTSCDAL